jgi:hypothetical protein
MIPPLAVTIFLGAFLVFQVQPIIARYILPWFGGSPSVWTAAMLFFQVMLLAGYTYTHFIVGRLPLRRQVSVHLLLLALTLILLPITPPDSLKPNGMEDPVWAILLVLLVSVGIPYVLVASTAPLMQSWYTKIHPGRSPYRLYALSNMGSILGLLMYPFVVEPLLGARDQTLLWSFAYGLFVAISFWTAIPMYRLVSETHDIAINTSPKAIPAPMANRLLWLALSACGVIVLLAATNHLCKDVAVIPLLWVLPLTLYLLSFIISFGMPRLYYRPVWALLLLVSVVAVVFLLLLEQAPIELELYLQVFIYSTVVFTCSMVCHGELFRLRPPESQLTLFYLLLALGGALGGVFVSLVAPLIFLGYWEFHWSLVATLILLGLCIAGDRTLPPSRLQGPALIAGWFTVGILVFLLAQHIKLRENETIAINRSFFGILRISEVSHAPGVVIRKLNHGRINHGSQILDEQLGKRPVSYFGPDSGIGVAIKTQRSRLVDSASTSPLRIGVIGQGVSTIAAFGEAGDVIRFYEIDARVSEIANTYFTYLSDSKADTIVVIGDARISMESELTAQQYQGYDVLAVDAFSGDGIPVHLLTREALSLYRQHMTPQGVIAIHISNRHFDLRSVVRSLASDAGMHASWITDSGDKRVGEKINDWVLLTDATGLQKQLETKATKWPEGDFERMLWTDDYANVLAALWRE